nr:GNAT family N-acetyltransferase [uncultured Sellimonas sp.]
MENILYRPIEKRDYETIKDIICHAFFLDQYMEDKRLLEAVKSQYLYNCLLEATYTCVAEKNGTIVGVIMGNAKKDYHMFYHIPYLTKLFWYMLKLFWHAKKQKDQAAGYQRLQKIYHQFYNRHKGEFDGVLTLFAVNADCRGLGIGKNLMKRCMTYLKRKQVHRIYLYTDTTCTYEVYEHWGFKRLEEAPLQMKRLGKAFHMDIFLYGYSFHSEKKKDRRKEA